MIRGFTCGVFDLFHAGHAMMLKECKENCDYLVIGLNKGENLPSNKNKPIYTFKERKIILESSMYVDEVIGYNSENDLTKILKKEKFDVRFLGDDYNTKKITSPKLSKTIYFVNRDHGFSSSRVRDLIIDSLK